MLQQNGEGSKVGGKGRERWFCALISSATLRESICWEQRVAFEVVCERGTKAKNTILYKEKKKRKERGGEKKERVSSYLPGFGLLLFREGKLGCGVEAPRAALAFSGGPAEAGGAVPVAVAAAAAGRGAGSGALPGLRGSRPRSLSAAARSRGRAACAWPSPPRAPPPRRGREGGAGPCPHLPAALWGRFPTCRGSLLAVGLGGCLFGGDPGPAAWPERPGIARVAGGGDPARRGELAQVSGLFGERHVAGLLWLCCTVAEKGIPIESWQTFLE